MIRIGECYEAHAEKLTELFRFPVDLFNETMDEEYMLGEAGIMLRFFTPDDSIQFMRIFAVHIFRIISMRITNDEKGLRTSRKRLWRTI